MIRAFPICVIALLLSSCLSHPDYVKGGYSEEDLILSARHQVEIRGASAWEVIIAEDDSLDIDGRVFRGVHVFAKPNKIGDSLCRSNLYVFSVYDYPASPKWNFIDYEDLGHSTYFYAVVLDGDDAACDELPLDRYFNVPVAIESDTLVALYSNFIDMVKRGEIDRVTDGEYKIMLVRLLPIYGEYRYFISIDSERSAYLISVYLQLESATFKVVR